MDPGIDDALALILALKSPEVQILGITTVAGNASLEMTTTNARRVLEYLNVESIPVAMGAEHPLTRPLEDALGYHGPDGLGNCGLPPPRLPLHPDKAWDFLARLVLDTPDEITLIATGPLINVAHAFQRHPELPKHIRNYPSIWPAWFLWEAPMVSPLMAREIALPLLSSISGRILKLPR
jgi:inosine-uridine nucleoside N-ribohydrolase